MWAAGVDDCHASLGPLTSTNVSCCAWTSLLCPGALASNKKDTISASKGCFHVCGEPCGLNCGDACSALTALCCKCTQANRCTMYSWFDTTFLCFSARSSSLCYALCQQTSTACLEMAAQPTGRRLVTTCWALRGCLQQCLANPWCC